MKKSPTPQAAFDIIRAPVNTERARQGWAENPKGRVYTFEVAPTATKADVKAAVEKAFSVHVADVRTLNRKGKFRRRRIVGGYKTDTKRAMVRLAPDQKISFFDGI
ncbi:MAG: 50S ribosomal protein L23 [Candidatus Hydrogenedentota bacterium]